MSSVLKILFCLEINFSYLFVNLFPIFSPGVPIALQSTPSPKHFFFLQQQPYEYEWVESGCPKVTQGVSVAEDGLELESLQLTRSCLASLDYCG